MSSRNLTILAVVLIAVIAVFFVIKMQKSEPQPKPPIVNQRSEASVAANITEKIIEISSSGFNPAEETIKEGESVSWVNQDTADHQVNSAVHPTHLLYPPLNTIGLLKPGEKKSLSFPTKGTYKFHDHLNPQFSGTVIVE